MGHSTQEDVPAAVPGMGPRTTRKGARLLVWLAGAVFAVLMAAWLAPSSVQAGTVTIVDGPNTQPVSGVFTDGYIQA